MMGPRLLLLAGAVAGFVAVAAGAFGAHGLEGRVPSELLSTFETGVRYHAWHALALVALAPVAARWPDPLWGVAGALFLAGIVVFSGSLYVLTLTGARWWGAVTPLGGVSFLAGWVCLAVGGWRAL
jgi:uncharacterized membrane protein YgdD (TMEM256/DUF423 family)